MKKRGDTYILYIIIELAIAFIIVFSSKDIVEAWVSNEAFDKIELAKDISLQIDALYAIPGNIYIINENRRNFSASFSERLVSIYKKDKEDTAGQYNYIGIEKKDFEKKIHQPERIILIKNGDNIEAEEEITELNKLNYPTINTKDAEWKNKYKLFIDPGHGGSKEKKDPGIENNNLNLKKESLITLAIAEGIKGLNSNIELTRDYETYVSIADRKYKLKEADMIISIHIGKYDNDKNSVKAYIPFESNKKLENEKLASLILNSLITELDFDIVNIIPIDTKTIRAEEPEAVLQFKDKTVILLEIGNINNDKGVEILNKLVPIPNLINKGVIEYFEGR